LVDSFADAGLPNAQMGNAREIVSRLDPTRFHVSMFALGQPDVRILERPNTRVIQLPRRRQTLKILREFLWGDHDLIFYLKSSPSSQWYLNLRKKWGDRRPTIGTMESQSDLRNEPTITADAIRLWEKTVLRCDYIFSNSSSVQDGLKREYAIRSEVIPTGVDTKFFSPEINREANQRLQVLFVGSLRPFKRPEVLLAAATRFPQADFKIAGDGPLAPELKSRVAQHGLSNVRLLGLLDAEKLRDEYRGSDIFLFPSAWEGSPKVVLEAAACGLPVVVRKRYSPETVVHGVTGYQAASEDEIFLYLETMLASSDLRRRLGRNGRQHSLGYDWGLITAKWEEVFVRLASGHQTRRGS
jgi:glycosyltransferase involved in cell wall biosynthesis